MKRLIKVGKKRNFKNVAKEFSIFAWVAIRRFCGFPRGLITLPIVIANANVINSILGLILCFLAKSRTIGVPIIANVSFIRNADAMPITNKISNINWFVVLAFLNIL